MTVTPDEPTGSTTDDEGVGLIAPAISGGSSSGTGPGVVPVAPIVEGGGEGVRDDDPDDEAFRSGETEVGGSDGPVGGTPGPA
ncbi:hypothetical protein EV189_2777 [Motilibacter rhizosphaerae]|uniref:Uncharacterized protein n=1 Tax=Motilibacter rhizosphaerae TaxID=598652 RepID=A0A4Q7NPY0_9ACTN|nr:hypothetical protein [Motilibacter rhizosphaerae]RZS87351.1 hypothetical protein EV189_2777 [Motilibacter rhizosphaerae]